MKKRALVVIDVQESFRQRPSWATISNPDIAKSIGRVGEVVVCGIRTEQCVETTARVASDFGYDVTFVTDATATNPIEHRDAPSDRSIDEILADPRTLRVEEIIARTEYALAGRFADIRTVEELAQLSL